MRFKESLSRPMLAGDAAEVTQSLSVLRHGDGGDAQRCKDLVAEECPVALVFNGISHVVMMATPADLEDFAVGFALSEGIVDSHHDIHDLELLFHADGAEVQLRIAQSAFVRLKQHRRTLSGRTGCGVCGIESLQQLDLQACRITATESVRLDRDALKRILAALPLHQPLMQATGGTHAAAWCTPQGQVVKVFEDVGRHNALDKLLGWMAQQSINTQTGLVFMTSRASYELVRKAARCNVPVMATISAPTALAIRIARESGIRLLSFCRQSGFVEYPSAMTPAEGVTI